MSGQFCRAPTWLATADVTFLENRVLLVIAQNVDKTGTGIARHPASIAEHLGFKSYSRVSKALFQLEKKGMVVRDGARWRIPEAPEPPVAVARKRLPPNHRTGELGLEVKSPNRSLRDHRTGDFTRSEPVISDGASVDVERVPVQLNSFQLLLSAQNKQAGDGIKSPPQSDKPHPQEPELPPPRVPPAPPQGDEPAASTALVVRSPDALARRAGRADLDAKIEHLHRGWQFHVGKKWALDDDRRRQWVNVLKRAGGDVKRCEWAIRGLAMSDFHMGRKEGSEGKMYVEPRIVAKNLDEFADAAIAARGAGGYVEKREVDATPEHWRAPPKRESTPEERRAVAAMVADTVRKMTGGAS